MNKIENKFNFKTFIMFLTVLVLSLSMVLATACSKGGQTSTSTSTSTNSNSTSESESEEALDDEQLFANGDFEHPTNKHPSKEPITLSSSSTKWTGSVDGEVGFQVNSSNVKRGIIDVEEEAYGKLNTTYNTVENPGTPVTKGVIVDDPSTEDVNEAGMVDGANRAGTKVLMLQNKELVAQFATSSTSLKVPAGEYGKLTVWVYTGDLTRNYGSTAGAYIKVKNTVTNPTVEGATYDPLVIENIDTAKTWVAYTIYLAPNTVKSSSYTLILGLGEGNKFNCENHVKGFAYFDNVSFELIDEEAYLAVTADKTVKVETSASEYSLTDGGRVASVNKTVKFDLTESTTTSFTLGGNGEYLDYAGHTLVHEGASFENNVLTIDFSSLAIGSAYTHTSDVFTLNAETYVRISFWANIDAEDYQTKATMSLYDVAKEKDVAIFENVSTEKDEEDEKDDGFERFTFYVANNFLSETMQYQLKLSFGPTDANSITDVKLLPTGVATFKDFEIEYLTKENYDIVDVTSDTRAKKCSLIGNYDSDYVAPEDEEDEETKDSYNVNVTGYGKELLENGNVVSLNELSSTTLTQSKTTDTNKALIGVVNSKYADKYNATVAAALGGAKAKLDEMRVTEKDTNEHVQALLVYNETGANFVLGNVISIPKNSTYMFSIRVYVHGDATAFVKLININKNGEDLLNYTTAVTSETSNKFRDGFATVTFIITTGFENYDVRLKFGVEGDGSVALFQSILPGSSNTTYTSYEAINSALNVNNIYTFTKNEMATTTYYYANESHAGDTNLALKDENGVVRKTVSTKKQVNEATASLTVDTTNTKLVIYNRLNLDDRYIIEAPEVEESAPTESTESTEAEGGQNYGWLQVTSIIIALALVAALVAVVVRKATEGKNKKRKHTETYYQGFNKNKFSKKNDVAVPDEDEKAKDYDYDNPENN